MIKCDCNERTGIEINSIKLFEDLKEFFESQVKKGIFSDIKITVPYYTGYDVDDGEMKWYADKWYRCNACGVLWEFVYPDFPAKGFVRKFEDGKYFPKE